MILDVLKDKIESLLIAGQPFPSNQGRQRFGTAEDIKKLYAEYKKLAEIGTRIAYLDFTPFERIGRLQELASLLSNSLEPRPVLLLLSPAILEEIRSITAFSGVVLLFFSGIDKQPQLYNAEGLSEETRSEITSPFIGENWAGLRGFRSRIASEKLLELLKLPGCLISPSDTENTGSVILKDGDFFLRTRENVLVSHFLNPKYMGRSFKALNVVAYELLLEVTEYFRRDNEPLSDFDFFITPNNTALFLASPLQAILERPVVPIDRLGAIPALNLQTATLRRLLQGKRVIVLEEVIATGSEIDRTILFLNFIGAKVVKVITLYDLEAGAPMLGREIKYVALCRPKKEIGYVYRSQ